MKIKKADIILTVCLLATAALIFLGWRLFAPAGKTVSVFIDGKRAYSFPLSENTERVIETPWGKNVLVIKEGKVFISSADCPDKICVAHFPISVSGETIICLPHRLTVTLDGEREVDAG